MPLPIQTQQQLVNNQVSAVQAFAGTQFIDFSVGSIMLAIIEANAANSLWIQALMTSLLAVTRLQTSSGSDVDTFVQQFGYSRLPAVASTGVVTFTRINTSLTTFIPASSTLVSTSNQTSTGSAATPVQFTTVVDTSNSNYDPTTNSYVMLPTITNIDVPVMCTQTGIIGNVLATQINTIQSPLINVNSVSNAAAFTNGANQATDSQVKADFVLYLQGLSRATYQAIQFAVLNTPIYGQQVARYQIIENKSESGSTQLGFFFVVVADSSGNASNDMLNAIKGNIEFYRGLAIQYDVIAAVKTTMTIVMTVTTNQNPTNSMTQQPIITAAIKNALINFINGLPIGGTKVVAVPPNTSGFLYFTDLYDAIFSANNDPTMMGLSINSIPSLTLDFGSGPGTADAPLDFKHIAFTATGDITVNYTV